VWPKTQPPYCLTEKVCVPYGCFSNVLKTKDFTPLDPDLIDHKFYAQGIGTIKTLQVSGGQSVENLVQIKGGDSITQQLGNSGQSSDLGSDTKDLKQRDQSKNTNAEYQPSQQKQQQIQDESKTIDGMNQSPSQ
jgi:hypothetical protein